MFGIALANTYTRILAAATEKLMIFPLLLACQLLSQTFSVNSLIQEL